MYDMKVFPLPLAGHNYIGEQEGDIYLGFYRFKVNLKDISSDHIELQPCGALQKHKVHMKFFTIFLFVSTIFVTRPQT